jgi:tetratricopeptide (TPR) repeat protein
MQRWKLGNRGIPYCRSRQVQQLLQEKKPDLAIPQLEAILALDPINVNAQANLGVLLYFRGDFSKAEPHLQAALNLQTGLSKIQGLLGIAQKRTGDPGQARVNLEAAFAALADGESTMRASPRGLSIQCLLSSLDTASPVFAQSTKMANTGNSRGNLRLGACRPSSQRRG